MTSQPQEHEYTHAKRPYKAVCIQYGKKTAIEVQSLFDNVQNHAGFLMVRHTGGIHCIYEGDWVVRGQNGAVKVYNDETFNIKYTSIKSTEERP
jgi:hypothetical protein